MGGTILTPRFKRVLRRAVRKGGSLRSRDRGSSRGVRPENIVWIFGTGRSGSTWLGSMMEGVDGFAMWNEPLVGNLFGNFYYFRVGGRKLGKHSILGEAYKETWLGPMRDLVLGGAEARFPEVAGGGYLIIKEPNGTLGAPLLMEALPESRMIFLMRDPRDVVASALDRHRKGGQAYERLRKDPRRGDADRVERDPEAATKGQARRYIRNVSSVKQAYEAHRGSKVMIRYEELRYDTVETLKRIYSTLSIPVEEEELAQAVEKNSWENVPEEDKGPRKNRRKATPGGWQEDLTREQVKVVEEITAPLLREFYPT